MKNQPQKPQQISLLDRYIGALVGLAVGDSLGTPVQFKGRGTFEPVTSMRGGGFFETNPGEWSDDTSMALCLAESLIECNGFDAKDQMERYVRWYRDGYLSSKEYSFDIGTTTQNSLELFIKTGDPFSGKHDPNGAGNGSLMRLAPIALAFAQFPEQAIAYAGEQSYTTHGSVEASDACRYFTALLIGALRGKKKEDIFSSKYSPIKRKTLCKSIAKVASGTFKSKFRSEIIGNGYVVNSLEAALWSFYTTSSFEECVLKAVNLGEDADTTAAIAGQIAGAYYGASAIPDVWRKQIAQGEMIEQKAVNLFTKFQRPFPRSYWVKNGSLLAGYFPGASNPDTMKQKITALLDCGVSCIINLMEEDECDWNGNPFVPYQQTFFDLASKRDIEVSHLRIPIKDQSVTDINTMKIILDAIDSAHQNGQCVYLHCWGGKGRTGTVVGCWLVRHGMDPEAALKHIVALRYAAPDEKAHLPSPENGLQEDFVRNWIR